VNGCRIWLGFGVFSVVAVPLDVALADVDLSPAPPPVALAGSHFSPYGYAAYQYISNVFYLPPGQPEPIGAHGPTLADEIAELQAGFDEIYGWDQQKLYLTAEARRFEYDNFTDLSHYEHFIEGDLAWKIVDALDGDLDFTSEKRAVQFAVLESTQQLVLETNDVATAKVNVEVSPTWRWVTVATATNLDSPRNGAPDLSDRERYIQEGLRYIGVANLSAGFDVGYLNGYFRGAPPTNEPPNNYANYHDKVAQFAANYVVSGLTSLNAAVGYTERTQEGNNVSGATGTLGYKRQLTAKTFLGVQLKREVNSYLINGGSELDTTAAVGLTWQATWRISINPSYVWMSSSFPGYSDTEGTTAPMPTGPYRVDHLQNVNLIVKYQALRWLSIAAYGRYQTRTSNEPAYPYNVNIVGIQAQVGVPLAYHKNAAGTPP